MSLDLPNFIENSKVNPPASEGPFSRDSHPTIWKK